MTQFSSLIFLIKKKKPSLSYLVTKDFKTIDLKLSVLVTSVLMYLDQTTWIVKQ